MGDSSDTDEGVTTKVSKEDLIVKNRVLHAEKKDLMKQLKMLQTASSLAQESGDMMRALEKLENLKELVLTLQSSADIIVKSVDTFRADLRQFQAAKRQSSFGSKRRRCDKILHLEQKVSADTAMEMEELPASFDCVSGQLQMSDQPSPVLSATEYNQLSAEVMPLMKDIIVPSDYKFDASALVDADAVANSISSNPAWPTSSSQAGRNQVKKATFACEDQQTNLSIIDADLGPTYEFTSPTRLSTFDIRAVEQCPSYEVMHGLSPTTSKGSLMKEVQETVQAIVVQSASLPSFLSTTQSGTGTGISRSAQKLNLNPAKSSTFKPLSSFSLSDLNVNAEMMRDNVVQAQGAMQTSPQTSLNTENKYPLNLTPAKNKLTPKSKRKLLMRPEPVYDCNDTFQFGSAQLSGKQIMKANHSDRISLLANDLFLMLFTPSEMALQNLTGKTPNAHNSFIKKGKLDENRIDGIIDHVTTYVKMERTAVEEEGKEAIGMKLNNFGKTEEAKKIIATVERVFKQQESQN